MSVRSFDTEDTISTSKGVFEVVAVAEHEDPSSGKSYMIYSIRDKKELDAARQEQADREAAQIEAQKAAEEAQAAEEKRVADLHDATHDPEALTKQELEKAQ